MGDYTGKSSLEQFAEVFISHGVEFIVVGGQAEILLGSSRPTYDVDLCYRRTKENLRRLAAALSEIKPTLRNAPPNLPFVIDEQSLALGGNFTFDTSIGALDLLAYMEPVGTFEEIASRVSTVRVGELDLKVIHIDDLITIKRHIQRPKDRDSLMHLLAIKKVQSERESDTEE